jgi:agmatine deiminase
MHPIQVRNPNFTKAEHGFFGVPESPCDWLGDGEGDDTHGHIDDLCRFINEDTIVTIIETNTEDSNYLPLQDNLKRLQSETGKQVSIIVALPMPTCRLEDLRLPASYANFLILNKCVLVSHFNDPNDRKALNILAECFPTGKS